MVLWAEHVAKNTARDRDDVLAEVNRHFSDAELVELTGICGFFAMLNRFQDSLHLPIEDEAYINNIRRSVRANSDKIKAHVEYLVEHWSKSFSTAPANGISEVRSGTAPGYSSLPGYEKCAVALLSPDNADHMVGVFLSATQQLLGGISNAARAWAHVPYAAMLSLPFVFVQQHEGAGCILPSRLKAMAFLRTSHLNSGLYTLAHNMAFARAAGLSEAEIYAARTGSSARSRFSSREDAALRWAESVVSNGAKGNAPLFEQVGKHFNSAELVELTALCGTMNMLDRMYNALRIPLEPEDEITLLNRVSANPARLRTYLVTLLDNWPGSLPLPHETT